MNKYEKALDELEGNAVQQQSHIDGYENSEYANMNGITKMIGYSQTLQELVDRATPMKPDIYIGEYVGENVGLNYGLHEYCGNCAQIEFSNEMNYCSNCGVEIDRGEDDGTIL